MAKAESLITDAERIYFGMVHSKLLHLSSPGLHPLVGIGVVMVHRLARYDNANSHVIAIAWRTGLELYNWEHIEVVLAFRLAQDAHIPSYIYC